jgi:hypothetical protein
MSGMALVRASVSIFCRGIFGHCCAAPAGAGPAACINVGARPEVACWAPGNECLAVGDAAGRLHFLRVNGTLVFSLSIFCCGRVPAGHSVRDLNTRVPSVQSAHEDCRCGVFLHAGICGGCVCAIRWHYSAGRTDCLRWLLPPIPPHLRASVGRSNSRPFPSRTASAVPCRQCLCCGQHAARQLL